MTELQRQTGVFVELTGKDGNIFGLVGIASRALKKAGFKDHAKEMTDRVFTSGSYEEALGIIQEYIEAE